MHFGTDAAQQYAHIAQQIVTIRDKDNGGAIGSFDKLSAVGAPVVQAMQRVFIFPTSVSATLKSSARRSASNFRPRPG